VEISRINAAPLDPDPGSWYRDIGKASRKQLAPEGEIGSVFVGFLNSNHLLEEEARDPQDLNCRGEIMDTVWVFIII